MELNILFQKAITASQLHNTFLEATEKNLSHFLFGRDVDMVRHFTLPEVDYLNAISSFKPNPNNPLAFMVKAFMEELANTNIVVRVNSSIKELPYTEIADYLESYLDDIHHRINKRSFIQSIVFELLTHGYVTFYISGNNYEYLTAYEAIPGDSRIQEIEKQPFFIRKTKVLKENLLKMKITDEAREEINAYASFTYICILDVWALPLDLNVAYLESGIVIFTQRFPYPKEYPFKKAPKRPVIQSFMDYPVFNQLVETQKSFTISLTSVKESSSSIAKPLLVYDADSGINVDKLQRALREGYRHIIIGKNREGDINFKAPGHLPVYAVDLPSVYLEELRNQLGTSEMFLSGRAKTVREKGAISKLMKTTYRKMAIVATQLEDLFSEIDDYMIKYFFNHKNLFPEFKFRYPEAILKEIKFTPKERFSAFASEETAESQLLVLRKQKAGAIPLETALEELNYPRPTKLIKQLENETLAKIDLKLRADEKIKKGAVSMVAKIDERLADQLDRQFAIIPITNDKVIVQCHDSEKDKVSFLLLDLSPGVFIEPYSGKKLPPRPEEEVSKPVEEKETPEEEKEEKEVKKPVGRPTLSSKMIEKLTEAKKLIEETRGRPKNIETEVEEKPEIEKVEFSAEEKVEPLPQSSFDEELIRKYVGERKAISFKGNENLPGMYIVEPHSEWIASGKKLLFLKTRSEGETLNKPYLLCGKKVYGIITIRKIKQLNTKAEVDKLEKYHLVKPAEFMKWWKIDISKEKLSWPIYAYFFEFDLFEKPLNYILPQGTQTFIKPPVEIKREPIGLPYMGDLKPIALKPWRLPSPHKPEKKAFQPHEVFSLERLKEIIPEASYDVSSKIDGLLAFLWVFDGKAKMYSDVGNKWPEDRVKPLLEEVVKKFKHDALLVGELVMTEIRRKDIAGYIHGQWDPTSEELESLRYIVWDILYVKDRPIASQPFYKRSSILDLYLPYRTFFQKVKIQRVAHTVAKTREDVIRLAKKLMSNEGVVIRDTNASYWSTHTTYKMKKMFDIDAKVIAVEKTKLGLPIFLCVLKDGIFIGQTYAQSQVKAKPGDIIRVNIDHVSIRPDGSVNWYSPKPRSWKEGKVTPKKVSTTQVGIGGPDSIDLVKEIFLVTGGTETQWKEWLPKFEEWKKEKMPQMIEGLKKKIKAGVPAGKT